MAKLYNLAREKTPTSGTGTITLTGAASGFLSFAQAGVTSGKRVPYGIRDGANSEVGEGIYTATGSPDVNTLTRVVTTSTNNNNPISLSGFAQVYITPRSQEMGMPLLASGSVNAVTSLDIDLSNYVDYRGIKIFLHGVTPVTAAAELWLRFSTNNGVTYDTTTYTYANFALFASAATPAADVSTSAAQILLTRAGVNGVSNSQNGQGLDGEIVLLAQTSLLTFPKVFYQNVYVENSIGALGTIKGSAARNTSPPYDVDHIRFLFSSGNIAIGDYAVYGLI